MFKGCFKELDGWERKDPQRSSYITLAMIRDQYKRKSIRGCEICVLIGTLLSLRRIQLQQAAQILT